MFKKTIQLNIIFLFCIVYMRSISITSIVRLKCSHWRTNPIQGCVGTFILPNVVLTTSYCAETCQSVGNVRIVRTYIHPHYKNYVHGNNYIARNDIALVVTPQDGRKRKLVKLSALDTVSTIGQKALYPIMDEDRPRLKVTIVEACYKEQPFGYYVCATNKVTRQTIRVCYERQEQGVPLLLEGRIFGIMGITDTDSCKLPQRSFTAIGPALFWISTTVKQLGYGDDVLFTLHDKNFAEFSTGDPVKADPIVTTTTTVTISSTTTPIAPTITTSTTTIYTTTPTTSTSSTTSPTTPSRESMTDRNVPTMTDREKIKEEETRQKSMDYLRNVHKLVRQPFIIPNQKNQLKRVIDSILPINSNIMRLNPVKPIMRAINYTKTSTSTMATRNADTAITFIPAPTPSSRTRTTAAILTTTTTQKTTIVTVPFFKVLANNKTTNVMDWFNENVKSKLKNNPSMYFIVSSSTTTKRPTYFIDLT